MYTRLSLLAFIFLSLLPKSLSVSVEGLPTYSEIENLTIRLEDVLETLNSQDRIFPSIQFTYNGNIIGWKYAAAPNGGGVSPALSIWRRLSDSLFTRVQIAPLDSCTVSEIVLSNNDTVAIHESGPEVSVPFEEGDILGLFLPNTNAVFVPLLYNSTVVGGASNLSFYLARQGIRLRNETFRMSDYLSPLFALKTCVNATIGNSTLDLPVCDGQTLFKSNICFETSEAVTTPTQPLPVTLSSELLIIVITVPVLSSLLVCVCVLLLILCLCLCVGRSRKRKRSHSMNTAEEYPMEDVVAENDPYLGYDHHTYDSVDVTKTAITTISNELRRENQARSAYYHDNGACANYEEPVFVLSQFESSQNGTSPHLYDTPRVVLPNGVSHHAPNTPLPDPPPPFTKWPSPSLPHPSLVPEPLDGSQFYHTLEHSNPNSSDLGLSSAVIHTTHTHHVTSGSGTSTPNPPSPSSTPRKGSPLLLRSSRQGSPQLGTSHSLSPKPRHRLKSAPNLGRRTHSGNHLSVDVDLVEDQDPPRPHSEQGYATLRTYPDIFFKLETGVYVPTKQQRNAFPSTTKDDIFDDTIYAGLSQAPHSPSVNNWSFFEESGVYWRPASNTSGLYEQLSSRKYREILRKQVQITEHLGSGEFGTVCKGMWHTEQGELDVAVKMLNCKASEEATVRFLQEAAIMGQFRHPNIVRLHGVITVGEPVMIVLELINNGDLRKYLKSLRPVPGEVVPADLPQKLLDFESQIALGMEYLSRKEFIHRDLAARNILLTEDLVCKIADFGMSRDLDDEEYYISNGGKVPIKWTAPEALHYRKYSPASDVWSFGALMYEIWSLGHTPYKSKTPEETVSLIDTGYRLPPPPGCPRAIYKLMVDCWHPDAHQRPTFTELVQSLSSSVDALLGWSHEDNSVHPQATRLGGILSAGDRLYPDLQTTYKETS